MINKLTSKNFAPLKKWSLNGDGKVHYSNIKAVRSLLESISGRDIVEMIRDVLKDSEKDKILIKYLKVGFEN